MLNVNVALDFEPPLRRCLRCFSDLFTRLSRKSFATGGNGLLVGHRRLSIQSSWERAPHAVYGELLFFLSKANRRTGSARL